MFMFTPKSPDQSFFRSVCEGKDSKSEFKYLSHVQGISDKNFSLLIEMMSLKQLLKKGFLNIYKAGLILSLTFVESEEGL